MLKKIVFLAITIMVIGTAAAPLAQAQDIVADKAAITKLLSFGGLTESDIRPDGLRFYMNLKEYRFTIYVEKPLGAAGNKAWVKKIFDKCKQLSADKKVYWGGYNGDEEIADSYEIRDFDTFYKPENTRWVYQYKGKWVLIDFGHGGLVTDDGCSFSIDEN